MRNYVEYLVIPFEHLRSDCYALVKKFYLSELNITLPELEYPLDWAAQGLKLIEANYEKAGFTRTSDIDFSYGNLIVFGNKAGRHLGVSLEDGTFLHTTIRGTARHSYLAPEWKDQILFTLNFRR